MVARVTRPIREVARATAAGVVSESYEGWPTSPIGETTGTRVPRLAESSRPFPMCMLLPLPAARRRSHCHRLTAGSIVAGSAAAAP
ncbi:hypothetical protein ACIGO6_36065 [Streptomyces sp. NPDC053750]|uniref:hypothetical protein n=1 Tax=Streptomyces sp. NPDC053750 TaxID=3365714 RepID=UPI0037D9074D